jgi:hypothetical protein
MHGQNETDKPHKPLDLQGAYDLLSRLDYQENAKLHNRIQVLGRTGLSPEEITAHPLVVFDRGQVAGRAQVLDGLSKIINGELVDMTIDTIYNDGGDPPQNT